MRLIKRLHIFMLQTFLPLFAMTFFIVLFIVLMQFLWKYIGDLVGKGLEIGVLGELFFYAALSMVPLALPLAILLASLMTFGNLGERFELTAMKASGISLIKVMAPLIVLIAAISVGAFFFQNNVLPKAQVKMWTLLLSARQKSPEVEIPEGVFYDQIPGYNLFVEKKNRDNGMLYGMVIYDVTQSGSNSTIIRADSAQMAFTKDMRYLYLHLFEGEQFENLREAGSLDQNVPFRRESFLDKQILIPFDANFARLDEEGIRRQWVGKDIAELRTSIDSVEHRIDSVGTANLLTLKKTSVMGINPVLGPDGLPKPYEPVVMPEKVPDIDSILQAMTPDDRANVFARANSRINSRRINIDFPAMTMADDKKTLRRHEIELLKKYTLSVACLIFFFIGAPLGAIIRKGGIGTPLVISVMLFLFYYIIDNTGNKMAREGHIDIWLGMWLSTFVLAPLGIYATVKAMNDSAVFDKDAYLALFRRWFGIREARKVELKEVILNEISVPVAISRLQELREECLDFLARHKRPRYLQYWEKGYPAADIEEIAGRIDADVEYLRDCRDIEAVNKLPDFPVITARRIYSPNLGRKWGLAVAIFFPLGLPVYLVALKATRNLRAEMRRTADVAASIIEIFNKNSNTTHHV